MIPDNLHKELKIGTCPPTLHELKKVKHHFIKPNQLKKYLLSVIMKRKQ